MISLWSASEVCMRIFTVALVLALLSSTAVAQESSTPSAILRCDPGTVIKDIDGGWKSYYFAGEGSGFKECAIPLSRGPHRIEVCFSFSTAGETIVGGQRVASGGLCMQSRKLEVDAQVGRTYRIRFDLSPDWKAFVDDVTEAEAGLSYEPPPERPKPKGSKKERETILVLRATPENAVLGVQTGVIRGKWFDVGMFGALKLFNFSRKGVPDGYHLYRAYGGDTVAFTSGQMMDGSVLEIHQFVACGDFRVRVHENLPAGRVLYLGHLAVRKAPLGYVASYSDDDIAEARAYIDSHHPELAGRLEVAPYREVRTTRVCNGASYDLSPGTGPPGS
jgi:hypothetical protein